MQKRYRDLLLRQTWYYECVKRNNQPTEGTTMKVYVDAKELLAAAKFCDDKKNKGCREILRCVHVESNENDYALVSTDSYKLIKFVHNNTNPDGTNDVFTCNNHCYDRS